MRPTLDVTAVRGRLTQRARGSRPPLLNSIRPTISSDLANVPTQSGSIEPGTQYQYSYNLLGQATGLAVVGGSTVVQGVQYNAAGQLTQMQEWTIGTPTLTRSYNDLRGWVTRITAQKNWPTAGETVLDLNYSYLANGRVSAVNDVINPGQSVSSYEYDEFNRLTKTVASNWSLQWTYDEFGNRLTQTKVPGSSGTPPEITLSYNESTNRITTAGYTFDLNGNLTALPSVNGNPALTMSWDVFNRAATISTSTKTYSMKYDAFGRRVEKYDTSLGTWDRRWSFWDPSGRLLAEYTWLPSAPGTTHKYFAGQRVGQWTDRTGSVRYAGGWKHYYPFGEEVTGTANDAYKFAELYRDAETQLDYAMARYNSSTTGRFLSSDPSLGSAILTNSQTWNRYAYSLGDPANVRDPNGLCGHWVEVPHGEPRWVPCPGSSGRGPGVGGGESGEEYEPGHRRENQDGSFEGADPVNARLKPIGLTADATLMIQRGDCGEFLVGVARTAFLNIAGKSSRDQLTEGERQYYDSFSGGQLTSHLSAASWYDNGDRREYDQYGNEVSARAGPGDGSAQVMTFFRAFFEQGSTARTQIVVHEAMHLIFSGFSDAALAKAANNYVDDRTASAKFHDKLREHCH